MVTPGFSSSYWAMMASSVFRSRCRAAGGQRQQQYQQCRDHGGDSSGVFHSHSPFCYRSAPPEQTIVSPPDPGERKGWQSMGTAILRSSEILCSAQKGRFLFKQGRRCCFRQSPGDTTMAFALGCVTRKQVYSFYAGSRLYLPEPFDPGPVKRLLVTVGMGYPFEKSAFHRHVLLASGGGIGQNLSVTMQSFMGRHFPSTLSLPRKW